MTDDVLTLVRMANGVPDLDDLDAGEIQESQAAINEALHIERTPGLTRSPVRRSRLRPILVAAAVAIVVTLVIGIPLLLSRSSEEPPVVDEPSPTTVTTVVPTTAPATTAAPPQTTEAAAPPTTVVELPPVPDLLIPRIELPRTTEIEIAGVAPIEGGMVAVGFTPWVGEEMVAEGLAWVSEDGMTWEPVDNSGVLRGDGDQVISDIAAGPGGLVAVGYVGYDGAAWTSSDGLTWWRAAEDEALGGNDVQEIHRVVAGGPGYVAVGRNGSTAGVWTSHDGQAWTLVEDEIFGSYSEPATAFDVAALPTGIAAVGSGGFESDRFGLGFGDLPVVWVSPDGVTWDRLPIDTFGNPETYFFESIEAYPGTLFLESDREGVLRQWSSPDGRSWTEASWPPCGSDETGAILFAEYPGAECRGIGYLDGPDGAELDVNRITRIGSLLIITGGIHIPEDRFYESAMWVAAIDG